MTKYAWALLALGLATGVATAASAQDTFGTTSDDTFGTTSDGSGTAQPQAAQTGFVEESQLVVAESTDSVAISQRGITLPGGTVRGDATFGLSHISISGFGSDTATFFSLGAAFGIMDNLEAGISGYRQGSMSTGVGTGALPFQLTKDFNFGLVTPYARYRLLHDQMLQLAAELTLVLPTASGSDFGIMLGVPFRLMLAQMFAIDTGVYFTSTFADSTINSLTIPLGFIVNVMPALFLLARMNFTYSDFDARILGLDFGGGYTIESNGRPMLDIMATFGFPGLLVNGNTFTELWQLNVTAAFRLDT